MTKIIGAFVLLLSSLAHSRDFYTVLIFESDTHQVVKDASLPSGSRLEVYNLDALERSQQMLNQLVGEQVDPEKSRRDPEAAYQDAFFELLNSSKWSEISNQIDKSTAGLERAVRYQVKKVPAIIFDHRYVIYGVSSLSEAISILKNADTGRDA